MQEPGIIDHTRKRSKRIEGYKVELEYRWLWKDYLIMVDVRDFSAINSDGTRPSLEYAKDFATAMVTWANSSVDPSLGSVSLTHSTFLIVSKVEVANEIWDNLKDIYLLTKLKS